ncbi:hypothetical protein [Rudaea sp.]|uniref:hypothetical protein n=1 Tax=Rudaea sp. TaxID=2136325 RepID=UPI002ED11FD1
MSKGKRGGLHPFFCRGFARERGLLANERPTIEVAASCCIDQPKIDKARIEKNIQSSIVSQANVELCDDIHAGFACFDL